MSFSESTVESQIAPEKRPCEVCGARVPVLRRNRCWGCYSRWVDSRPVGLGAACSLCGDRRHEVLKMVELLRTWVPLCHNCAARATQLSPMPKTLFEIRNTLARQRRENERRLGMLDGRHDKAERRGLERRNVGLVYDGDMMILGADDMEILVPRDDDDDEQDAAGDFTSGSKDETCIRPAPTGPE